MNIGFDAKRAFRNRTGLGTYSRLVIESLVRKFPMHRYALFATAASELFPSDSYAPGCLVSPSGIAAVVPSWWRSRGMLSDIRSHGIDIFHGLSNELPFGIASLRCRSLVTIHDLIFLRYPQYYSLADRKIYRKKSERACHEADHIVAVSEQTGKDIIEFYKISPEKVSVVHQAIHGHFYKDLSEEQLAVHRIRYSLSPSFILYVGTVEERKNLLALIKALSVLKPDPPMLVVVGKPTAYKRKVDELIRDENLEPYVRFLAHVPGSDLPALYRLATMVVYPSVFEGFGLPIAEALASGTPVITSGQRVFHEAGGTNSLYVDVQEPEHIAAALSRVLSDEPLRIQMSISGKRHARRFHPANQADRLMSLYESLDSER